VVGEIINRAHVAEVSKAQKNKSRLAVRGPRKGGARATYDGRKATTTRKPTPRAVATKPPVADAKTIRTHSSRRQANLPAIKSKRSIDGDDSPKPDGRYARARQYEHDQWETVRHASINLPGFPPRSRASMEYFMERSVEHQRSGSPKISAATSTARRAKTPRHSLMAPNSNGAHDDEFWEFPSTMPA
jgi:hypothetical protein